MLKAIITHFRNAMNIINMPVPFAEPTGQKAAMLLLKTSLLLLTLLHVTVCHGRTVKRQKRVGDSFNCPSLPPLSKLAQTVYELRPQDIKVVMALGDSVTAAFAARGLGHGLDDWNEFRGISWSVGGDPGALTIASFLRHYSPDLVGMSLGQHSSKLCYGQLCPKYEYVPELDQLNAAQSGAMIPDVLTKQLPYLINQLTEHPNISMQNDWKLLTILIGFNDICLGCANGDPYITVDSFERNLRTILDEIRLKIPRVFVNLVQLFNVSMVYTKSLESIDCTDIHKLVFVECFCAFAPGKEGDRTRKELDDAATEYNNRMRLVATEYADKQYPDFAVVIQPGFKDGVPRNVPLNFLSNFDCFHPSVAGHQSMAKVIWNNMLAPAALKRTTFDFRDPYTCPTNETLLYIQ